MKTAIALTYRCRPGALTRRNPLVKCAALLLLLSTFNFQLSTFAQGTAFTYQGRLSEGPSPVNGSYDLTFQLFDTPAGGSSQGGPMSTNGVILSDGLLTVTLDFGANPFSGGAPRWLEISVRTNGGGAFGVLNPRQALTATPYAITAGNVSGTVAAGQIGGTLAVAQLPTTVLTNYHSGVNLTGSFAGDGSALSNLNVTTTGGAVSNAWQLGGNAGTSPGANFLGTTDNQPLELRVNGQRALRIEPTTDGPPNFIGGASANFVAAGTVGATIGGGGATNYLVSESGNPNSVSSDFGTIGGGFQNRIDAAGFYATVGGGRDNTIETGSSSSTIAGGDANAIGFFSSAGTIGGGYFNTISPNSSYATIPGGVNNIISPGSFGGTIGGGQANTISPNSSYATIPGGIANTATSRAFAAGTGAKAVHNGAFVWADSQGEDFSSSGANQFLIRASGNVGINKNNPATALDVSGTITASAFSGNGAALSGVAPASGSGSYLQNQTAADQAAGFRISGNGLFNGGRVGIGTGNPMAELHVNGAAIIQGGVAPGATSSSNLLNLLVGGGSLSAATNGSLNGISFYEAATVKAMSLGYDGSGSASQNALRIYGNTDLPLVTFQNSGNVGIGTTAPITALHVKDTVDAEISLESNQAGAHRWGLQSRGVSGNIDIDASFQIIDRTLGQSRLLIRTNGDIGIGTSTPATALHIRNTGDTEISLESNDAGRHRWTLQSSGVGVGGNPSTDASFQIIDRTVGEVGESRLLIDRNGNVGIGNVSPATALHVKDSPDAEISIESLQAGAHRWTLQSSRVAGLVTDASFQIIDRTAGESRLTIHTDGSVYIPGTISSGSDRNSKTNFAAVDAEAILNRVLGLPIQQWRFRAEKEGIKHIGPMAQDFHAAFGLGAHDTSIATVDADGVALAAIQGLNQKVEERAKKLEDELKRRDTENAELKQRLNALEKLIHDRL